MLTLKPYAKAMTIVAIIILAFSQTSCSTFGLGARPKATEYTRTYSYAMLQSTPTRLRDALAMSISKYKGKSGFNLLTSGKESLRTRLSLIKSAEKTIDLQYYSMNDDITGNLLLKSVTEAADRGVRVRFLIDAIALKDVGAALALLNEKKNIEVRIFNPMATKDQGPGVLTGFFADLTQIDKRMHNKVFIVDNQAAIIGGRNLGDEYFDEAHEANFKDLDILSVGPITANISESFDAYWNSDESFPVNVIEEVKSDPKALAELRQHLVESWSKYEAGEKSHSVESMVDRLKTKEINFIWANAEMVADNPEKIDEEKNEKPLVKSKPLRSLVKLANEAEKEFLIISPYFVPREAGLKWLSKIHDRGVNVKVLTNSLSSTDVVIVYSGYQKYCLDLVQKGIDLYELKRKGSAPTKQRVLATTAPPYASLHAKVYIVDRRDIIIGSFNFDPRSVHLNTEMALMIHSTALAAQLKEMFDQSISSKNSYHLLDDKGRLAWITEEDGKKAVYHSAPEASVWRKMQAFFMSMLPVENKL